MATKNIQITYGVDTITLTCDLVEQKAPLVVDGLKTGLQTSHARHRTDLAVALAARYAWPDVDWPEVPLVGSISDGWAEGNEAWDELEYETIDDAVDCECGDVTGAPCGWRGPESETVVVEYMPEHLREGHAAGRGAGVYPVNGAVRIRCERSCAEAIVENEDGWAEIVTEGQQ